MVRTPNLSKPLDSGLRRKDGNVNNVGGQYTYAPRASLRQAMAGVATGSRPPTGLRLSREWAAAAVAELVEKLGESGGAEEGERDA